MAKKSPKTTKTTTPFHQQALIFIAAICLGCVIAGMSMKRLPHEMTTRPLYGQKTHKPSDSTPSAELEKVSLEDTEWVWQETKNADGSVTTPKDPQRFVLSFKDGSLASSTDCNRLMGSYQRNEEVLSIGNMASTLMFCEGSQEAEYSKALGRVGSYSISGKTLTLILVKDAGTMKFVARQK